MLKLPVLIFIFFCSTVILFVGCSKEIAQNKPQNGVIITKSKLLATIFNNNMVIQRDKPCVLWGYAPSGKTVNVQVSWNTSSFQAVANTSNIWKLSIPAASATIIPQTITCTTADSIPVNLNNILIGDVWICSGQSNMVKTLKIVPQSQSEISAANYPDIRVATIPDDLHHNPLAMLADNVDWIVCSPQTIQNYSAISYYFARELNTSLNIPIGIIVSALDGSTCQEWVNNDTIDNNTLLQKHYKGSINSQLYNGMLYPLGNLSIKGFTWYQGEANRYDDPVSNYTVLNSALINNWRALFNQGNLPFYFVQVAPYDIDYSASTKTGGPAIADDYAKFREAQANVRNVAGTGMAITMDVGDSTNLHPANKQPVGERLALLALKNVYGLPVQCVGPQFLSYSLNNDIVTVNFVAGTASGLTTAGNAPLAQYFFVAGKDNIFRQGTAVISGEQVIITAPANTPLPIQAVRYAFTNYPITNLQNSAGLPAEPFRTDNWAN